MCVGRASVRVPIFKPTRESTLEKNRTNVKCVVKVSAIAPAVPYIKESAADFVSVVRASIGIQIFVVISESMQERGLSHSSYLHVHQRVLGDEMQYPGHGVGGVLVTAENFSLIEDRVRSRSIIPVES